MAAPPDPRTLARVPLGRGLAQGEHEPLVSPGSMGEADNLVINRAGRFDKRIGWGLLPDLDESGVDFSPGVDRVDGVGAELLRTNDDGTVHSWGPGRGRWESLGWLPPFRATNTALIRTQSAIVSGGFCRFGVGGKYELAVFQHSVGGSLDTYAQIRDTETGALIGRDALAWSPSRLTYPVTFRVGNTGWVVYGGGDVRVAQYRADLTFPDSQISATVFSLIHDAAPVDGASRAFVALTDSLGAPADVLLYTRGELNTAIANATFTHSATVTELTVSDGFSGEYLVCVCSGGSGARALHLYRINATTLAVVGSAITVKTGWNELAYPGVALDANGDAWITFLGQQTSTDDFAVHVCKLLAGGTTIEAFTWSIWRVSPAAKAFRASDGLYLPVYAGTNARSGAQEIHCALVRLDAPAGSLQPDYAGVCLRAVASTLVPYQHVIDNGDGTYEFAAGIKARVQTYGWGVIGLDRLTLTEARPRMPAVRLPQQYVWAGAGLWGYDGFEVHDVGFLQPPILYTGVSPLNVAGTSFFAEGDYLYRARYEYLDDQNVMHVSPWSNDLVVTVAPAATYRSIDLKIATTQLTRHGLRANRQVTIALYRSTVDGVVDGVGTLYRLTGYGLEALEAPYNTHVVNYNDDEADATSPELGFILTTGDVLEAAALPPLVALCVHRGRLWAASAEPDHSLWPSLELQTDESPRFNPQLRVQLPDASDPITAIASLDDKLAVFTSSRLWAIYGDGPADTGQGGGFSVPYPVHGSFGCIDPGSVVSTSRGVYFRASSGICLLDRALNVSVVGDPVRDLLDEDGAELVHAVYHEAQARVIWHLVSGAVEVSRCIIYDERHATWTTASSLEVDTIDHLGYHREERALLLAGPGGVYQEGYGAAPGLDGAASDPTHIPVTLTSPWLRPGGEVGSWALLHAFHLEGDACGPSEWTFTLQFDYRATGQQTFDLDLSTYSRDDRIVWQIVPKSQSAQAFRVRLVENVPASLPADDAAPTGASWWGLVVDSERVPGLARISPDLRGGTTLWPWDPLVVQ